MELINKSVNLHVMQLKQEVLFFSERKFIYINTFICYSMIFSNTVKAEHSHNRVADKHGRTCTREGDKDHLSPPTHVL